MFWDNFVKLCNERGVKPNPVAKELKLSSGSVTAWKNGAEPRDTALQKIADYFGISVSELTKEKKPPNDGGFGEENGNEDKQDRDDEKEKATNDGSQREDIELLPNTDKRIVDKFIGMSEEDKDLFIAKLNYHNQNSHDYLKCGMTKDEKSYIDIFYDELPPLYRYRKLNENTLSAFINDEIWGALPSTFNDPFDTQPCYSEEKLRENISYITSDEQEREELRKGFIDHLNNYAKDCAYVVCLSLKNNSAPMWAHYTDYGKGFVLSYSADDLRKSVLENYKKKFRQIFPNRHESEEREDGFLVPVFYHDAKQNCDSFFDGFKEIKIKNKNPEDFISEEFSKFDAKRNSLLMYKSFEWMYEKEWRLFFPKAPGEKEQHSKICNVRPTGIYLGFRMKESHKDALIFIAKTKKIPVYEMEKKITGNSCSLIPKLIYSPDKEETL